jgi:hypothetical protein
MPVPHIISVVILVTLIIFLLYDFKNAPYTCTSRNNATYCILSGMSTDCMCANVRQKTGQVMLTVLFLSHTVKHSIILIAYGLMLRMIYANITYLPVEIKQRKHTCYLPYLFLLIFILSHYQKRNNHSKHWQSLYFTYYDQCPV